MFLFLKMAFGNIFKNTHSSVTIMIAVFISVFAMEFTLGYMDGFKMKLIDEALSVSGNIRVYNTDYYNDLDFAPMDLNIADDEKLNNALNAFPGILSVRKEINFGVMASTEETNQESMVQAIDYRIKSDIYDNRRKEIKEGRFIENDGEVVIGVKMAKILKAKIGDKIVMLSMDQYGSINAVEGEVCGIFRNFNPTEEEGLILCSLGLAQKLLSIQGAVTEVIVNVEDPFAAETAAKALMEKLPPGLTAVPWQIGQPILNLALSTMDAGIYIIAFIILFVAGLGIINSFLMNIMGRLPEFGVLRAMGVSRPQLFVMIIFESFLLGVIGTIAGLIPGVSLVYYFQVYPISYEAMGSMMDSFGGINTQIGTALTLSGVVAVVMTGILISVAASVYPAFMAINKKPVDILRVLE